MMSPIPLYLENITGLFPVRKRIGTTTRRTYRIAIRWRFNLEAFAVILTTDTALRRSNLFDDQLNLRLRIK